MKASERDNILIEMARVRALIYKYVYACDDEGNEVEERTTIEIQLVFDIDVDQDEYYIVHEKHDQDEQYIFVCGEDGHTKYLTADEIGYVGDLLELNNSK